MAEGSEEIQRGARFSVQLSVSCYRSIDRTDQGGEEKEEGAAFEGEVKNISSSGACLVTSYPLKINEVLKVSFPIQSSLTAFITTPRTLVEVRWIKPLENNTFITGLRFLL
jgi:hypothetical protein